LSKLKNPVGRSTEEWVGKTADTWPPPPTVQLRVLMRQNGKCAITGHEFKPGDKKALDHIKALADHGENRESNLQWIMEELAHRPKTAAENSARAPIVQRAKTHAGIGRDKQPVKSDPHALKSRHRPKHEGRAPCAGTPALMRQGFVSLGDVASGAPAKLNPRKAAE
jgi:5-methylcytosine-specific restriction protein A